MNSSLLGSLAAITSLTTSASASIAMDWVTVGNAGNAAQSANNRNHTNAIPYGDGYGAVAYDYRIGKYEVTNAQYAAFLNATAKSDTYALYNLNMDSSPHGGIIRSGSDGNYTYVVKTGMGNKPVVFVNWFDAARMANWMHNGQGGGSTETGAYSLNGLTGGIILMNEAASVWVPKENEWFKAAYYNGTTGMYSLFSTGADTINTSLANYGNSLGTVADVGAYPQAGFYGTYDQSGNVFEWLDSVSMSSHRLRGGSWSDGEGILHSAVRNNNQPLIEVANWGFRLASVPAPVPEPSTYGLILGGLALAVPAVRRRRSK